MWPISHHCRYASKVKVKKVKASRHLYTDAYNSLTNGWNGFKFRNFVLALDKTPIMVSVLD